MDIRRLEQAAGLWTPPESTPRKAAPQGNAGARDRVDLGKGSDSARNPAVSVTRLANATPAERQERVEAVKEKVESGFYDRPEVIDQVAGAMIDKGFVA